jgi:hypothetical protein
MADAGKQVISDLMAAIEDYLLEFIFIARTGLDRTGTPPLLAGKRERLIEAIDKVRQAEGRQS